MSDQTPPPQYPVGSIVNGHVWTGTEWVPAQVVPPPAMARPRKPPLSEQFQQLPGSVRAIIIVGAFVVGLPILWLISRLGSANN